MFDIVYVMENRKLYAFVVMYHIKADFFLQKDKGSTSQLWESRPTSRDKPIQHIMPIGLKRYTKHD